MKLKISITTKLNELLILWKLHISLKMVLDYFRYTLSLGWFEAILFNSESVDAMGAATSTK